MAGRKKLNNKSDKKPPEKIPWHKGLKEETKYSIWGIIFLALSLFLLLAIFKKAGPVGNYVYSALNLLLGKVIFFAPLFLFILAVSIFSQFRPRVVSCNLIGVFLIFLSSLALVDIIFKDKAGGYTGFLIALPFLKLFDFWASLILFLTVLIVGFLIIFNIPLSLPLLRKKSIQPSLFPGKEKKILSYLKDSIEDLKNAEEKEKEEKNEKDIFFTGEFKEETPSLKEDFPLKSFKNLEARKGEKGNLGRKKFKSPPLDLLEGDKGKPSTGDIKANANIIKRTLQNFGINVEMNEVRIGPSVTQYTLKPAEGVKLSRITSLQNDLALALASHPIRIEAPIPGKSLVGIEVPNRSSALVGLRYLLEEDAFQNSELPLTIALGRNVAGRPVYTSIAKMPHLLIAGATGAGKSVCIHSLVLSLLYRHSPWELQFLMIDPKRVELTLYNDLPYLLSPVITEAKKAIMALKWATQEMEKRYDKLLEAGARDINSYHQKNTENHMPYIVIVIDELADIMATYPREFEASIVRLAQMSRAVGIHLVVSTQRPSVEVITGLIKANITSRIAFQVATQVDSRTILDMAGAERLLGNGDMLFLSSDSAKPRRIQGAFVSEREVKKVVKYLIDYYEDLDLESLKLANGELHQASIFEGNLNQEVFGEDELFETAKDLVIQTQKASASFLQRRLRVGYARAARLLDMLEERGIVGPADGAKPREVLVKKMDNY